MSSASLLSRNQLLDLLRTRADLAIKWRFFRHLLNGGDPDSERVYRWHIETRTGGIEKRSWKRTTDHYLEAARALLVSMRAGGFDPAQPIVIASGGTLYDGAHRLACGLFLGAPIWREIVNARRSREWDEEFLRSRGLDEADMARVLSDWLKVDEAAQRYSYHA